MKLAFYYPRAAVGDGGVTISLWSWVEALTTRGHTISILVDPEHGGALQSEAQLISVPHIGGSRLRVPKSLHAVLDADVLVLSSGWTAANWIAAAHARRLGVPYIVVPHGAYEPALIHSHKAIRKVAASIGERRMLEGAIGVHVFFGSEVDNVLQLAPLAHCFVSPTGVSESDPSWRGGGGFIAWIGRYDVRHKGLDLLLYSLARVPSDQRPTVRLFGRDSKDRAGDVQALVEELGLKRWCSVAGPVSGSEKDEILDTCDGYVHPSRWECHSVGLAESLRRGVPTLVSSSINIADDLRACRAALVEDPSSERFAAALQSLVAEGPQISVQASAFARDRLSWATAVDSLEEALVLNR